MPSFFFGLWSFFRMWKQLFRYFDWYSRPKSGAELGVWGEQIAVKYLKRQRYRVVESNVRFPFGEIDIVAIDQKTVVFVEVKTRRSPVKFQPWEAVDTAKQRKLIRLGGAYLRREGLLDQRARFDIVSVSWDGKTRKPEIEQLIDAFGEDDVSSPSGFDEI